MQEEVAARALLIAEQPPGTQPLARNFPSRNRIIAGLSLGTVVVEAAPRSGSLITARLAGEAGREVMAVPGSPLDPRAQGCNLLIRDGGHADPDRRRRPRTIAPDRPAQRPRALLQLWRPAPADADDTDRRRVTALLGPVGR